MFHQGPNIRIWDSGEKIIGTRDKIFPGKLIGIGNIEKKNSGKLNDNIGIQEYAVKWIRDIYPIMIHEGQFTSHAYDFLLHFLMQFLPRLSSR